MVDNSMIHGLRSRETPTADSRSARLSGNFGKRFVIIGQRVEVSASGVEINEQSSRVLRVTLFGLRLQMSQLFEKFRRVERELIPRGFEIALAFVTSAAISARIFSNAA